MQRKEHDDDVFSEIIEEIRKQIKSLKKGNKAILKLYRDGEIEGTIPPKAFLLGILQELKHRLYKERDLDRALSLLESVPVHHSKTYRTTDLKNFSSEKLKSIEKPPEGFPFPRMEPLPFEYVQVLDEIYTDLMTIKTELVAWSYSYPLEHGEVMNDAIRQWKKTTLLHHDEASLSEFTRGDVRIEGEKTHSNVEKEEIEKELEVEKGKEEELEKEKRDKEKKDSDNDETLQELSPKEITRNKIKDFVDESDMRESDKPIAVQWIASNGGQNVEQFIRLALEQGELGIKGLSISEAKSITPPNWYHRDKKNLMDVSMVIYSFRTPGYQMMFRNEQGEIEIREDMQAAEEIEKIKGKKRIPLLEVHGTIQLDAHEGRVDPKVIKWNFLSFTEALISPEEVLRRQEKEKEVANNPGFGSRLLGWLAPGSSPQQQVPTERRDKTPGQTSSNK